ncbi:hypothetical protein D3C72_2331640 [compost metagenome]
MPEIKYRWKNRNTATTGIRDNTVPAITNWVCDVNSPFRLAKPSGSVLRLSLVR